MDYGIIVYNSITTANRAKKLSENRVGHLNVIQAPVNIGVKGCSYSIRCRFEDVETIRAISEKFGLRIKAVFRETIKDGKKEYIRV